MPGRRLIDRSARLPRPDADTNQGFRGCRFRLDKEVSRCAKHEPQVGGNSTKKTTGRTSERLPGEADESGIGFTKIKGPRKRALLPAKRRNEHSGWRRTRVVWREDSRTAQCYECWRARLSWWWGRGTRFRLSMSRAGMRSPGWSRRITASSGVAGAWAFIRMTAATRR